MKKKPADAGKRVRFELWAEPGSQVFVAGTFNNWSTTMHELKDSPDSGQFRAALRVPAGTHEYRFVVNGVWHKDPTCLDSVPNGHGSRNSVIHV